MTAGWRGTGGLRFAGAVRDPKELDRFTAAGAAASRGESSAARADSLPFRGLVSVWHFESAPVRVPAGLHGCSAPRGGSAREDEQRGLGLSDTIRDAMDTAASRGLLACERLLDSSRTNEPSRSWIHPSSLDPLLPFCWIGPTLYFAARAVIERGLCTLDVPLLRGTERKDTLGADASEGAEASDDGRRGDGSLEDCGDFLDGGDERREEGAEGPLLAPLDGKPEARTTRLFGSERRLCSSSLS